MKARIYGIFILLEAFFMMIASMVALYYNIHAGEQDVISLLAATMITAIFGFILLSAGREKVKRNGADNRDSGGLTMKDSFVLVTMTWVLFCVFGMLPFIFSGSIETIADAFFETMSGFTTTGSTIMENIDAQPHGILFWRSMIQWLGGLGIIVLFLAILPALNKKSNKTSLYAAEMSGLGVKKLHPKMAVTSRHLYIIYIHLTVVCALVYWAGPMDLYDAVCHALTTLSSGGFSTHQASIGYYNSSYLEYICSFFMMVSGVNFSLYYFLFRGDVKYFAKNEELRWWLIFVVICVAIVTSLYYVAPKLDTVLTVADSYPENTFEARFRTALFHVTSLITSTGYQGSCYDYSLWGGLFLFPTLLIMISGSCAGSTSGGVKIIRLMVCLKSLRITIRQILHPNAVFTVKVSKEVVSNDILLKTLNFLFLYVIIFIVGVMFLAISGCNLEESVFNAITALSNMGPGYASTGPASTFAGLTDAAKWVMSFLMLLGRLEIYTVLLLFMPSFWNKK